MSQEDDLSTVIQKSTEDIKELLNRVSSNLSIHDCVVSNSSLLDQTERTFVHQCDLLAQSLRELSVVEADEKEELETLMTALKNNNDLTSKLLADIQNSIDKNEEMKKDININKEDINRLQNSLEAIRLESQQLNSSSSSTLQTLNSKIALYNGLTNVHWKQTGSADKLVGYVDQPKKKDVVPFSYDLQSCSQFDVANSLWDKIASSSAEFMG